MMAEEQLSVRSTKAKETAHRLARAERRTVAAVVERALYEYEGRRYRREPIDDFLRRLAENAVDIDLMDIVRQRDYAHYGPDFSGPDY